jgi:hypothetical protein
LVRTGAVPRALCGACAKHDMVDRDIARQREWMAMRKRRRPAVPTTQQQVIDAMLRGS